MFVAIILLIIGFVFLVKGADFLVDGASSVAKKVNVPLIVVGLTVVAFGTSMPELVVSLLASINGNPEIALANVAGSNIANILLILGVAAAIYPLSLKKNTIWKEIPLSVLAILVLLVLTNDLILRQAGGFFLGRIDGIILLIFFGFFLYYTFRVARTEKAEDGMILEYTWGKSILRILLGIIGLILGGKLVVDSATNLATMWGVSETLIGLTIVALGTSLPELVTSAVAALKKNPDIAIGNVVGSNIFNVLLILGISSVVKPLYVDTNVLNIDLLVVLLASLLLFVAMFVGKRHKLERWQGILFVVLYLAYVGYLIIRG